MSVCQGHHFKFLDSEITTTASCLRGHDFEGLMLHADVWIRAETKWATEFQRNLFVDMDRGGTLTEVPAGNAPRIR